MQWQRLRYAALSVMATGVVVLSSACGSEPTAPGNESGVEGYWRVVDWVLTNTATGADTTIALAQGEVAFAFHEEGTAEFGAFYAEDEFTAMWIYDYSVRGDRFTVTTQEGDVGGYGTIVFTRDGDRMVSDPIAATWPETGDPGAVVIRLARR